MFSKLVLVVASAAALVVAGEVKPTPASQCNTGNLQCCNSVQDANSKSITDELTAIGASVQGLTGQAGLTCSPISVIGLSSNSWYVFFLRL